MASLAVLVLSLLTVFICKFLYTVYDRKIRGIPEPSKNLILGHILRLGDHFGETFLQWKTELGPVFQLRFLNQRVLVLNDKESIKKVSSLREASGRPQTSAFKYSMRHFGLGIASGDGPFQDEQRQFYLKSLPTFGEHRRELEKCIKFELEQLISNWAAGEEFELEAACSALVFNSVFGVLGDKRLGEGRVKRLLSEFDKMMDLSTRTKKFVFAFTGLAEKISPKLVKETFSGVADIVDMAKEILDEHQKDRVFNQPRNMIDKMLDKMDVTEDPRSTFHRNQYNVSLGLHEIVQATVETTSKTLEWFMLYMTQYPQVLSKIRAEIKATFGDAEVDPLLCHKTKMPFVQACILETLRLSSVFPLAVTHRAVEPFKLDGSTVPKGTFILMNTYAVHHDPKTWKQPHVFNPLNFLGPDGQIDRVAEAKILPFGAGRRMCIGSKMVDDIFFLFITSVYSKLDFELTSSLESLRGKFGVTVPPPKATFKAVLAEL